MIAPRLVPAHVDDVFVSSHALDRVREHHPNAGWRGALRILADSRHLAQGEVAGFLHRALEVCRDEYFLAPGHLGIFVVAPGRGGPDDRPRTLVTYIRLSPMQRELAASLWGEV